MNDNHNISIDNVSEKLAPKSYASPNFTGIPQQLKDLNRWVLWRRDKEPYQPNGYRASTKKPHTWCSFGEAKTAYERGGFEGVGIVLGDGLMGIDLDKCFDDQGKLKPSFSRAVLEQCQDTYCEKSPSSRGVHILYLGDKAGDDRCKEDRLGFECYDGAPDHERYFTVTGRGNGKPIAQVDPDKLKHIMFGAFGPVKSATLGEGDIQPDRPTLEDQRVIDLARSAANGWLFSALYDADKAALWASGRYRKADATSEADLDLSALDAALCGLLAFWCDAEQIERIFNTSKLVRDKWINRPAYREATIQGALDHCQERYKGEDDLTLTKAQSELLASYGAGVKAESGAESLTEDETPSPASGEGVEDEQEEGKIADDGFVLWNMNYIMGQRKRVPFLIEKHIPERGVIYLAADPNVGKTYIALGMSLAIATGTPWVGAYRTQQAPVLYVGEEGCEWNTERIQAWCKHHNETPDPDMFCMLPQDVNVRQDVDKLIGFVKKHMKQTPKLIVFDTFPRMLHGDENSQPDIRSYFEATTKIRRELDTAVMLVSHPGLEHKDRLRGHSSQTGSADCIIIASGCIRTSVVNMNMIKQKGVKKLPKYCVSSEVVRNIGTNEYDEPTSNIAVANHGPYTPPKTKQDKQREENIVSILSSLTEIGEPFTYTTAKNHINDQGVVSEGTFKRYWTKEVKDMLGYLPNNVSKFYVDTDKLPADIVGKLVSIAGET